MSRLRGRFFNRLYSREVDMTKAQRKAIDEAKRLGGWFLANEVRCSAITLRRLVDSGHLVMNYPSGGPAEYCYSFRPRAN